jgi:hypothetical protein
VDNGSYATKDQILQADDLTYEDVHVQEWDLTVRVRSLTGAEFAEYQRALSSMRQEIRGRGRKREVDVQIESHVEQAMLKLCGLTMVDGDGNRLFTDQEVGVLGRKSHRALIRIYEVAERLSGLNEEAVEAEGKDSETTTGDERHSELPAPTESPVSENSSVG